MTTKASNIFVEPEDYMELEKYDSEISMCHRQVGLMSEEVQRILNDLSKIRKLQRDKVLELEIKYRLKGINKRWFIDKDKQIMLIDNQEEPLEPEPLP